MSLHDADPWHKSLPEVCAGGLTGRTGRELIT